MDKKEQGKKNRKSGSAFELKVRKDLEKAGWIICKWTNNVEFGKLGINGELVPAKRRYNPFMKALSIGNGFPDFVGFQLPENGQSFAIEQAGIGKGQFNLYLVIGIEAKSNGYLNPTERKTCTWLLENNIFSKILIAKKGEKRGEIVYKEFQDVSNG
jgi:hypothetical protein